MSMTKWKKVLFMYIVQQFTISLVSLRVGSSLNWKLWPCHPGGKLWLAAPNTAVLRLVPNSWEMCYVQVFPQE